MHDTLGDVDVVLPYDARDFLESWNSAEIVLTDSFAIVISLNKRFDLKGGRERAQRKQVQDKQWANGQTGELPEAGFMAKAAAVAGNINVASTPEDDLTQVKILGQRDETTNEASVRRTEGQGWLATSVLVPAFALLLIAADQTYTGDGMELWFWMIPCLLLFALALWLIWGPRATGNRLKVNRVSGSLNLVTLQNPSNSTIDKTQMFLGDKFPIVLPKQWANWAEVPPNSVVDLDMRVDDYSVVRMGNKLSLDQEEQRFPSVFWGRHLTLSTVGALMLLAAWINSGSEIAADLAHAEAGLKSQGRQAFDQPEQLVAQVASLAGIVQIKGQVRCQIAVPMGDQPPPISCEEVRWGGEAPRFEPVSVSENLLDFYSGELLQARNNPMLDIMLQMQMPGLGDENYNLFRPRPSIYSIANLGEAIKAIDVMCKKPRAEQACKDVKDLIGSKVILSETEEGLGWDTLFKRAAEGKLTKERDGALASKDTVSRIRELMRTMVEPQMFTLYAKPLQAARDSQHGGVVLKLWVESQQRLLGSDSLPSLYVAPNIVPYPGDTDPLDWVAQWTAYQQLGQAESLKTLEIEGLVINHGTDARGDLVLEVDPSRTLENYPPALLRLVAFGLGLLFLLVHGVLFAIKLSRALQRQKAVAAYYAQLHANVR